MEFHHKFASLLQVNSSNSQDKYLVQFLVNFAAFCVFCEFRGISRIYLKFVVLQPREIPEAMFTCLTLSKAFDTANHKILFEKLNHGIKGLVLEWVKSYLNATGFFYRSHSTGHSHRSLELCTQTKYVFTEDIL